MGLSKQTTFIGLKRRYFEQIMPELKVELGISNNLAVPRLQKVAVNVGIGKVLSDPKIKEVVANTLSRVTGQKPVFTRAKKSISSFKIRQGMIIGVMVTLRGQKMYDFLDKLINISLPRIRDFRGIDPKSVDQRGNLSIGIKEHTVFPEIRSDELEQLHGLEIQILTSAKDKAGGFALLKALGIPFSEQK